MKQTLVALSSCLIFVSFLVSCATPPEQTLVGRAVQAMGGADRLNAIKTVAVKANVKHWEPEQSDVPGGEPRFAAPLQQKPGEVNRVHDVGRLELVEPAPAEA